MWWTLISFQFLINIAFGQHSILYDCKTNGTVFLEDGLIAFFQTTNYPIPITRRELSQCNLTFEIISGGGDQNDTVEDYLMILSSHEIYFDDDLTQIGTNTIFDISQASSFALHSYSAHNQSISFAAITVKGEVAFTKNGIKCLWESENPSKINNENEVYELISGLILNSCKWRFTTSEKYGFKIVIKAFDESMITNFSIRNSTNSIANLRSAKVFHPYYNADNYLEINVSKIQKNLTIPFQAYVSVVKKEFNKNNERCHFKQIDNATIIWNLNTPFQYFNVHCKFDLVIPSNTEVDVVIAAFNLEKNVDFLRYTFEEENGQNITEYINVAPTDPYATITSDTFFTMSGYTTNSVRKFLWEYILDGSVPSFGTNVTFNFKTCKCIDHVIDCTWESHSAFNSSTGIMDRTDSRYCGNLKCNFTILPCSEQNKTQFNLNIQRYFFDDTIENDPNYDVFRVYSNNSIVLNVEINTFNSNENIYQIFFDYSDEIIFEVVTYFSKNAKRAFLFTKEIDYHPSVVLEATISGENPLTVIDMGLISDGIFKIKISKEILNSSIIIYCNIRHGALIYEDESLTHNLGDRYCFGDQSINTCKMKAKNFAIYQPSVLPFSPLFVVQLLNYRQPGCVFSSHFYFIKDYIKKSSITAISTPAQSCTVTILIENKNLNFNSKYFYFSNLWTTSENEKVKVYGGTESFLFEFDSKTAKRWTSIILTSFLYTIVVPKKSAIFLKIIKQDIGPADFRGFYPTSTNYYSLISTQMYGIAKSDLRANDFVYCSIGQNILKFTAIYFNGNPNDLAIGNPDTHKQITVSNAGEIFTLKNECLQFEYNPDSKFDPKTGMVFLVEIVKTTHDPPNSEMSVASSEEGELKSFIHTPTYINLKNSKTLIQLIVYRDK